MKCVTWSEVQFPAVSAPLCLHNAQHSLGADGKVSAEISVELSQQTTRSGQNEVGWWEWIHHHLPELFWNISVCWGRLEDSQPLAKGTCWDPLWSRSTALLCWQVWLQNTPVKHLCLDLHKYKASRCGDVSLLNNFRLQELYSLHTENIVLSIAWCSVAICSFCQTGCINS